MKILATQILVVHYLMKELCKLMSQIGLIAITAWNVFKYGVISGPYFPAVGLNTERYFVSLHIQSECGKIQTRNYSVFGHFSRSDTLVKSRPLKCRFLKFLSARVKIPQIPHVHFELTSQFFFNVRIILHCHDT